MSFKNFILQSIIYGLQTNKSFYFYFKAKGIPEIVPTYSQKAALVAGCT